MGRYAWFIGGVAAWFLGAGMQQVLFAWLLVGELHQDSQWVGTAQMCQTLPALLFLLLGGLIADRLDRRRLLVVLHALAAVAAGEQGGRCKDASASASAKLLSAQVVPL